MLLARSPDETPSPPSQEEFEAIFRAHAPYVWRVLRRLGVAAADVEDVCQEVFLVVHRRWASFHGGSAMRTWIYGIATRVASEHRRRPYRRNESAAGEDLQEVAIEEEHDERLDRRRALDLLDAALEKLDEDKRAVFVLFEVEEMPMNEVAAAVGCPAQTAYARLYAARRIVSAEMARLAGRDGERPPEKRSAR
ncbi:MAG: sigma-70 family RNA polymerase sigma factor [Polyangiaceae bacterium]